MKRHLIHLILFWLVMQICPSFIHADVVLNWFRYEDQQYPSITRLSNGNFAVAWWSNVSIGSWSDYNIFTPNFLPIFWYETQLPTDYINAVGAAALAASEDSFFVGIFNMMKSDGDTSNTNIFIKKLDNYGNALINDTRINSDTLDNCKIVDVLIDDVSDIIFVSWYTEGDVIFAQRDFYIRQLDFSLNPLTNDILIYENDDTTRVGIPRIARLSENKMFAVWSREYYYSQEEIIGTYFNIDGSGQVEPFVVNTYSAEGTFDYPNIISTMGGGVLIVWSATFNQYEGSIWGRRFDSDGQPLDPVEILLTVPDMDGDGWGELQNTSSVYQNEQTGDYFLIWAQLQNYPSMDYIISCRFLDSNIQPLGDTIRVSDMEGSVELPKGAFISNDSIFAVWSGFHGLNYQVDVLANIVENPSTIIQDHDRIIPEDMAISTYPNPFNSRISIGYSLRETKFIEITVFNIIGQKVEELVKRDLQPGSYQTKWDASDQGSGIYFIRYSSDDYESNKKVVFIK